MSRLFDSDEHLISRSGVNHRVKGSAMPAGDDSQRPGDAGVGYTRYNTQRQRLEVWTGSEWLPIVKTRDLKAVTINPYTVRVNGLIAGDLPVAGGDPSDPGLALTYTDIPAGYTDLYIVSSMQVLCAAATDNGQPPYQPYASLAWSYDKAPSGTNVIGFQSVVFPRNANAQGTGLIVTANGSVANVDDTRSTSVTVFGRKAPGGGPMQIYDIFLSILAWNTGSNI